MATACKIGIVKENQSVEGVICWWDGQPENAGETLTNHYATFDKAAELIAGGQLMELGKSIAECRYQTPSRIVTAEQCKPTTYRTEEEFLTDDQGQEFTYLFKEGAWQISEQ